LIEAPLVYVAEHNGRLVGLLRGSPGRLHSLFVDQSQFNKGIGRKLLNHFEQACKEVGVEKITLASTLYAVPFYQKMGYKKSTGVRRGWSFDGEGFLWQPMKKVLK
jgi:GNAT superfamily N-acetyltransferase